MSFSETDSVFFNLGFSVTDEPVVCWVGITSIMMNGLVLSYVFLPTRMTLVDIAL